MEKKIFWSDEARSFFRRDLQNKLDTIKRIADYETIQETRKSRRKVNKKNERI